MEKHLTAELKKVRGKEGVLFKLATAAVDKPEDKRFDLGSVSTAVPRPRTPADTAARSTTETR